MPEAAGASRLDASERACRNTMAGTPTGCTGATKLWQGVLLGGDHFLKAGVLRTQVRHEDTIPGRSRGR